MITVHSLNLYTQFKLIHVRLTMAFSMGPCTIADVVAVTGGGGENKSFTEPQPFGLTTYQYRNSNMTPFQKNQQDHIPFK